MTKTKIIIQNNKLAVLVGALMFSWSLIFANTYGYSFYWDDLHFIRAYSLGELISVFYGPNDPDQIETPALRPVATLLFCLQGTVFGEIMVLQRLFMAVLMAGLLFTVGTLLRELNLSFYHVAVVLVLFVCSRIFASLMLWITLGSLVLCYIFILLAALFYVRWVERHGSDHLLAFSSGFAILAVFTREEAYTLPVVLPLLWLISTRDLSPIKRPKTLRRAAVASLGIASIMVIHFLLRWFFVPDAPTLNLSLKNVLPSIQSAWLPGGLQSIGQSDHLIKLLWGGFIIVLVLVFLCVGCRRRIVQFLLVCVVGFIWVTPALGVPRSFGIALPSLAFFTAISIAVLEVGQRAAQRENNQRFWPNVISSMLLLGLVLGALSGLRRSTYVAEALHENSATRAIRDGQFVFEFFGKPATIPVGRREAKVAQLARSGVQSKRDIVELAKDIGSFIKTRKTTLFLEKYDYLSF